MALAATLLTIIIAWPLPPYHLPATTLAGVALALGIALILTPLRWRGHTPASRYECRQQVFYRVGARWGTALTVALTLYALHVNARLVPIAGLAALGLWWLTACVVSRDARYGFLAGTLLGLATF